MFSEWVGRESSDSMLALALPPFPVPSLLGGILTNQRERQRERERLAHIHHTKKDKKKMNKKKRGKERV